MRTSDFDYELPASLIAQQPLPQRDQARMLALDRSTGAVDHGRICDLPDFLQAGDLMVVNDTRVIPARLYGHKARGGGRVEVLLIEPLADGHWQAWCKVSGRVRPGAGFLLASERLLATVASVAANGTVILRMEVPGAAAGADAVMKILEQEGVTPLPPYIRRPAAVAADRERYQTVYARSPGAVAAPTAGLHFTPGLMAAIERHGVGIAALTLHVGPGTFKPVTSEQIEDHDMESERYEIKADTANLIERTRQAGGRVLAIGSTTVRTLEHVAARHSGRIEPGTGRADIFIRPGFRFRVVDTMLTNFHLPRSTLLMMVAALAGRERVLAAYRQAVLLSYRFYSYGDCMLIN